MQPRNYFTHVESAPTMHQPQGRASITRTARCAAAIVGIGLLFLALPSPSALAANKVVDVRVESVGDGRNVIIETTEEPTFTVFRLTNPMRVVVDISNANLDKL